MIALVHRRRCLAGQHRRHSASALLALRPAGAQVQPGLATVVAYGRLDPVIDGPPLGIGQQHAIVGIAHPSVQTRHRIASNAQEQLGTFAAFVEQALREDARPLLGRRVEPVLLHRATPGVEDQRRHRHLRQAFGVLQHAADTVDVGFGVRGKHGASGSRVLVVMGLIKRRMPRVNKHSVDSRPAETLRLSVSPIASSADTERLAPARANTAQTALEWTSA
ncbi:hypothetical protein D3C77_524460 [compost metagenome]